MAAANRDQTRATAVDSSDIDLFLLTVPGGGASSTLDSVGASTADGSSETITTLLTPGETPAGGGWCHECCAAHLLAANAWIVEGDAAPSLIRALAAPGVG